MMKPALGSSALENSVLKTPDQKVPVAGQLLYPVPTAARILGISPRLLWEFIARGEVKTRKIRARRLVSRKELERFASKDHERQP